MNRVTLSAIVGIVIIGGSIVFAWGNSSKGLPPPIATIINGTKVIEIDAKGGYSPRVTLAKANMPTILKVKTQGTFDCSSALRIPKIGYGAVLPASGTTEIEIPPQETGSTIQGLCVMGMYNFQVRFN